MARHSTAVDPCRSCKRGEKSVCAFAMLKSVLYAHLADFVHHVFKIRLRVGLLHRIALRCRKDHNKACQGAEDISQSGGAREGCQAAVKGVDKRFGWLRNEGRNALGELD